MRERFMSYLDKVVVSPVAKQIINEFERTKGIKVPAFYKEFLSFAGFKQEILKFELLDFAEIEFENDFIKNNYENVGYCFPFVSKGNGDLLVFVSEITDNIFIFNHDTGKMKPTNKKFSDYINQAALRIAKNYKKMKFNFEKNGLCSFLLNRKTNMIFFWTWKI